MKHLIILSCAVIIAGLFITGAESQEPSTAPVKRASPVPNPNSTSALLALLRNPEIASELGIETDAIVKVQREMDAKFHGMADIAKDPVDVQRARSREFTTGLEKRQQEVIEELLTPDKLVRLKQLAYRHEIQRMGFTTALCDGWLAGKVGVHGAQRETIARKVLEIENELEHKIFALRQEAEKKVLSELTPEQRKNLVSAIGEPLTPRNKARDDFQSRMDKEWQMIKAIQASDESEKK